MTGEDQLPDDFASDKARTTGHQYPHAGTITHRGGIASAGRITPGKTSPGRIVPLPIPRARKRQAKDGTSENPAHLRAGDLHPMGGIEDRFAP